MLDTSICQRKERSRPLSLHSDSDSKLASGCARGTCQFNHGIDISDVKDPDCVTAETIDCLRARCRHTKRVSVGYILALICYPDVIDQADVDLSRFPDQGEDVVALPQHPRSRSKLLDSSIKTVEDNVAQLGTVEQNRHTVIRCCTIEIGHALKRDFNLSA